MTTRRNFMAGLAGAGALAGAGGSSAQAQPSAESLVASWTATGEDGRERIAYFGADGLVFFALGRDFVGGRWALEGEELVVRRNWRLGYHAFLDSPTRHAITDFRPGERFTLEEGTDTRSVPIVHTYFGPNHPVEGALWAALVGRYLAIRHNGTREILDFKSDG